MAAKIPVLTRRYDGELIGYAKTVHGARRVCANYWRRVTGCPHAGYEYVEVGHAYTADDKINACAAFVPTGEG
jgi:hypothetical protein